MRTWIFPLSILAVASCVPSTRLTVLDQTPRSPKTPAQIELYRDVPQRSHSIIAVYEFEDETLFGRDRRALERRVLARAAALGADAVILSMKEEAGLLYSLPSMVPGVVEGEAVTFSDITKVHARLIVWQ